MCSVDTVSPLPDAGDDRSHYPAIILAVVFSGYPIDEHQVGLVEPVYSLFESATGKIGDNLKPGRYRAQVADVQTSHQTANLAFGDNIWVRVLSVLRRTTRLFSRFFQTHGPTRSQSRSVSIARYFARYNKKKVINVAVLLSYPATPLTSASAYRYQDDAVFLYSDGARPKDLLKWRTKWLLLSYPAVAIICLTLSRLVARRLLAFCIRSLLRYSPGESPISVLKRWDRREGESVAASAKSVKRILR